MSDLSGLNNLFGSITSKQGRQINFNSIDSNRDGIISQNEFNQAKNRYNVTVDFSFLDTNNDGKISEEEYGQLQQNKELQTVVNSLKSSISADFSGIDSAVIPDVIAKIREFAISYASDNSGVENMVELFRTELQTFYEDLKTSDEFANRPSMVLSRALDKSYKEITDNHPNLDKKLSKKVFDKLESIGEAYVKAHINDLQEENLINYLVTYMNTSDADKLSDSASAFLGKADSYGEMIDKYELKNLKNDAKAFLTDAVNQGVVISLKGVTIRTTSAIDSALAQFSDGNELRDALKEAIANLSDTSKIDEMIAEYEEELINQTEIEKYIGLIEQVQTEINSAIESNPAGSYESTINAVNELYEQSQLSPLVVSRYMDKLRELHAKYLEAKNTLDAKINEAKNIDYYLDNAKKTDDSRKAEEYYNEAKNLQQDLNRAIIEFKRIEIALNLEVNKLLSMINCSDPNEDTSELQDTIPIDEPELYDEAAIASDLECPDERYIPNNSTSDSEPTLDPPPIIEPGTPVVEKDTINYTETIIKDNKGLDLMM